MFVLLTAAYRLFRHHRLIEKSSRQSRATRQQTQQHAEPVRKAQEKKTELFHTYTNTHKTLSMNIKICFLFWLCSYWILITFELFHKLPSIYTQTHSLPAKCMNTRLINTNVCHQSNNCVLFCSKFAYDIWSFGLSSEWAVCFCFCFVLHHIFVRATNLSTILLHSIPFTFSYCLLLRKYSMFTQTQ